MKATGTVDAKRINARLIASGDMRAMVKRADLLAETVDTWARVFTWPALFSSFRSDIEQLRAAARSSHARH